MQMLAMSFAFLVEPGPSLSDQLKVVMQLTNAHCAVVTHNLQAEHILKYLGVHGEFVLVLGATEHSFDGVRVPIAESQRSKGLCQSQRAPVVMV